MGSLHEANPSVWVDTSPATDHPALSGTIEVDVVVVGAGITGLTTALLLQLGGASVAVVEQGDLVAGSTGYTTAKVSSLHGLTYATVAKKLGADGARQYAEANEAAIALIAGLVDEHGIECDFERQPAFTYTTEAGSVSDIADEVAAAQAAGLAATFTTETDLPYEIAGAVRVEDQAQFHPRRYCLALADAITAGGGRIFQHSRATDVDRSGDRCTVRTPGGDVVAGHVVLATLLPFLDRGLFFAKAAPYRSYAMAVRIDGPVPTGMYLSSDSPTRSVRPLRLPDGDGLVIGGGSHKVGQADDTRSYYDDLERWGRETFGVTSVEHRWSAQDFVPADSVPYIGRLTRTNEQVLVATGFKKWGMTNGTVAAMILSDTILGREPRWDVFDAKRLDVAAQAHDVVKENVNVAEEMVTDHVERITAPSVDALEPGHGGIVKVDGDAVAAYKADDGTVTACSAICTHLGGVVQWNTAEQTWDCPLHGSRYTCKGEVLTGPTVKDLAPKT
jgi:glycine/D-amino acid oxidase-like deaminating enzyme/nitrite reductase/ring-hydroxylating ferredoxin subunit